MKLGAFHVEEKIQNGGVGTVWLVTDREGRFFAAKQLSEENRKKREERRRFRNEAAITRRLSHPGVVKVHDYYETPTPFFTMEYFDGENLKYVMRFLADVVRWRWYHILRQVAEALAYVHSKGIIHKDVKPENVLVSPEGEVRLIDFSLSQTRLQRLLQFGRRAEGTLPYMAPEQILGYRCDKRADIYSFGVLLFEVLATRLPFIGRSESELIDKHLKEQPPPLRRIAPMVPRDIETLCQWMLAKRRDDRLPDLAPVVHALAKCEQREPPMKPVLSRLEDLID